MSEESFSMDFQPDHWLVPAFLRKVDPVFSPPMVKVYLASSLTCVPDADVKDCELVTRVCKKVFGAYDYEGIRFHVYDPADVTKPGSIHTPEQVFETDYRNVVEADLVAFHVSTPSLGVGEESLIAATAMVPRIVIYRRGAKVSRMFLGTFTPAVATLQYDNEPELEHSLSRMMLKIARHIVKSARRRRPLMKKYEDLQLGRFIFKQRIRQQIPISDLAIELDTMESWLRHLERDSRIAATASHMLLQSLMEETNSSLTYRAGEPPVLHEDRTQDETREGSLDCLTDYVLSLKEWMPDIRVFRLWNDYVSQRQREHAEVIAYREGGHQIVSVSDWKQRDAELGLGL